MIVRPLLTVMTPLARSLATAVLALKETGLAVPMLRSVHKTIPADGMPPAPTLSGRFTATAAKDILVTHRAAPLARLGVTKVPSGLTIAPSASLANIAPFPPPRTVHRV